MTEDEFNDITNLARLRLMQHSMMWLNSREEREKQHHQRVHKLLGDWIKIVEKKTNSLMGK
jgi:hypothetical protein